MRDLISETPSATHDEFKQQLRLRRFLQASIFSALYLLVLTIFYTQNKVDRETRAGRAGRAAFNGCLRAVWWRRVRPDPATHCAGWCHARCRTATQSNQNARDSFRAFDGSANSISRSGTVQAWRDHRPNLRPGRRSALQSEATRQKPRGMLTLCRRPAHTRTYQSRARSRHQAARQLLAAGV
jgi:hypothetical protein